MSLEHIGATVRKVVEDVGGDVSLLPPILPPQIRAMRVTREQFISAQHHQAWMKGTPLRRHLSSRRKLDRDIKDAFARGHVYQCALCPSTSLLDLDHIVPSALGGSSNFCNLRYLCRTDNGRYWKDNFAAYLRALDAYLKAVAA